MVKYSDLCLAVYDGRLIGGTALSVNLATVKNILIIQFNPRTLEIKVIEPSRFC
jgi:hypothetical protein